MAGPLRPSAEQPLPDRPSRRRALQDAFKRVGLSANSKHSHVLFFQSAARSQQQSARLKRAGHLHTLRMNTGYLEKCLSELCSSVLCMSCLKMDPDICGGNTQDCPVMHAAVLLLQNFMMAKCHYPAIAAAVSQSADCLACCTPG